VNCSFALFQREPVPTVRDSSQAFLVAVPDARQGRLELGVGDIVGQNQVDVALDEPLPARGVHDATSALTGS